MNPFKVEFPRAEIDDLRARLGATRWPDQVGDPWLYGTPVDYLQDLCSYWRSTFDFGAAVARLNAPAQFTEQVAGRRLHFIHQRSTHAHAQPLLITHGWPGSVAEFVHIVEPLAQPERHGGDPKDAFHVVCPSIPGYAFSEPAHEPGFHAKACARVFMELMARLGYTRYFAQGGDWGSAITTWLGALDAEHVKGIHLNLVFSGPPRTGEPMAGVTDAEKVRVEARRARMANEVGYQHIQGTKPQTLGVGLNDSPAGLASWIVEKFHGWTQHTGNLEEAVSRDDLLTNVSVYWFTRSITSSTRLYYENRRYTDGPAAPERVDVPMAAAIFPGELYLPPRAWVERQFNLVRWSELPKGGHFAALEVPEIFVNDVREAFRPLR